MWQKLIPVGLIVGNGVGGGVVGSEKKNEENQRFLYKYLWIDKTVYSILKWKTKFFDRIVTKVMSLVW